MLTRFNSSVLVRSLSSKLSVVVLATVAITLLALWAVSATSRKSSTTQPQPLATPNSYVRSAKIWPQLQYALGKLGDRLEKPGKERLTLIGTLQMEADSKDVPIRLFLELPRKMRLEEQGTQVRVVGFDGKDGWVLGARLTQADLEKIETLVFDSADNFFLGQTNGFAIRDLGSRFRLDDGKTPNYAGPFYDIYQVYDRISIGSSARQQPKLFYFNSDTQFLERVRYKVNSNNQDKATEIRISGWQNVNGQYLPTKITRYQGGVQMLSLTFSSASLSRALADGIFTNPQNK